MSFIVVFDDEQGLCRPMGWDPECEGALEGCDSEVAFFPDKAAAKTAVMISRRFALLRKAQGKVTNDDWLPVCASCIKIVPLAAKAEAP